MKRLLTGALSGLGFATNAFAGSPGFSTIQINWSATAASGGQAAHAVPGLGTYGVIALAILLALAAYRISRNGSTVIRAAAPLAAFGLTSCLLFVAQSPVAGISMPPPPIEGNSSQGSQTYTANGPTPPPCFVNNSGQPVTVTYTFVSGQGPGGEPLTAETCTFDYYCEEADEGDVAADGASLPSDGKAYATAYCTEIFGEGLPQEGNGPV